MAFGAAVPEELSEVADERCNQAVMKPLERKRFPISLGPEKSQLYSFCVGYGALTNTPCTHARKKCFGFVAFSAQPTEV